MNEKRTINATVHLTPDEYSALRENCLKANYTNMSAYMRKMIFDGYILNVDLSGLSNIEKLLRRTSDNINQIARRANINGNVYAEDIKEIQHRQKEIWEAMATLRETVSGKI